MSEKRRLSSRFPHRLICAVSVIICMCAMVSIAFAIVIWRHQLWGYYWATGFWSGLVLFFAGTVGVVSTFVRTRAAVTTLLVSSVLGCLVALGTVALSAGGLDVQSDFYDGVHRNQKLSSVCHGILLGLGTLELALCVLTNGVSIYYLFIERESVIYSAKEGIKGIVKKRQNGNDLNGNRYSTRSNAPLIVSASPRPSLRNMDKRRSARGAESQDRPKSQVTDRATLRSLRLSSRDEFRSPCPRSASFSTFGHGAAPDRTSSMISPGDSGNIADTLQARTPSESESLYAETVLFGPPLPIEEDDELPPYEPQHANVYENIASRPKSEQLAIHQMQLRRIKSTPVRGKRRDNRASRSLYDRIPHGRREGNSTGQGSNGKLYQRSHFASIRPSSSIDFLRNTEDHGAVDPGVRYRDISRSNDRIAANGEDSYKIRTQSLRLNRGEKRLLRKQRALSAEFRITRDQLFEYDKSYSPTHEHNENRRTSWIDSGETGHFAGNRVLPTRYSLRTPVRLDGKQAARTVVPVKSITTLPIFSPPPKPPRTHSVTKDDLHRNSLNLEELKDGVFGDLQTEPVEDGITNNFDSHANYDLGGSYVATSQFDEPIQYNNNDYTDPYTSSNTGEIIVHYEPTYTQIPADLHVSGIQLVEHAKLPERQAVDVSNVRQTSDTVVESAPLLRPRMPSPNRKVQRQDSVQDVKTETVMAASTVTPTSPAVKVPSSPTVAWPPPPTVALPPPPTMALPSPPPVALQSSPAVALPSSPSVVLPLTRESSTSPSMALPTSPVMKQPPSLRVDGNTQTKQTEYVYAKINKKPSNKSDTHVTEKAVRTASVKERVHSFDNNGKPDKSVEQEKTVEDKVVIAFVDRVPSIKRTDSAKGASGLKLGTRDLKTGNSPSDRILHRTNSNTDRKVVFKPASPTFVRDRGARPKDAFTFPAPFSVSGDKPTTNQSREPPTKAVKPSRLPTRMVSPTTRQEEAVILPTSPIVAKPMFKQDSTKSIDSKPVSPRNSVSGSGQSQGARRQPHSQLYRQVSVDDDRQMAAGAGDQRSPTHHNQEQHRSSGGRDDHKPMFAKFL